MSLGKQADDDRQDVMDEAHPNAASHTLRVPERGDGALGAPGRGVEGERPSRLQAAVPPVRERIRVQNALDRLLGHAREGIGQEIVGSHGI